VEEDFAAGRRQQLKGNGRGSRAHTV
jgi:hypothetical protein